MATKLVILRFNYHTLIDFQDVALLKEGGSLGFSIIGGTDHSCTPFGSNEPGIFISHVSSTQGKSSITNDKKNFRIFCRLYLVVLQRILENYEWVIVFLK